MLSFYVKEASKISDLRQPHDNLRFVEIADKPAQSLKSLLSLHVFLDAGQVNIWRPVFFSSCFYHTQG